MITKTTKFLIVLVCAIGVMAGCAPTEQKQNLNTEINNVVVGTQADVEIPKKFQAVAFKTIAKSETLKYRRNKNEFHGARALRDMFGDEKQKFDTTFMYLSDKKPIVAHATATWYVNHYPSGSTGYQLYYQKTAVAEVMEEGDLLLVGKQDNNRLFIIVAHGKSSAKNVLLATFQDKATATENKATPKSVAPKEELSDEAIESTPFAPTKSWYKVFWTPGPDCENNIITRMNKAKKVDILVYSITNQKITDSILAAHKRGAKIRIISDRLMAKGKGSQVGELADAGIPVRTNTRHKIEHNKIAIFDGKEIESGSYNWTTNATSGNSENCMIFQQTGGEFTNRYEYLWKLYEKK